MERIYIFILFIIFYVTADDPAINNAQFSKVLAQQHTKYISSPRWPLKYPTNCDIYYKIISERGTRQTQSFYLEIKWIEFDVKGDMFNCNDYMEVSYK